jgi:hypothetical protein
VLRRDDDYAAPGKPACDYDDAAAREALVDALAKDAHAVLARRKLDPALGQAAKLLPTGPARTWSRTRAGCSISPARSPQTG